MRIPNAQLRQRLQSQVLAKIPAELPTTQTIVDEVFPTAVELLKQADGQKGLDLDYAEGRVNFIERGDANRGLSYERLRDPQSGELRDTVTIHHNPKLGYGSWSSITLQADGQGGATIHQVRSPRA